MTSLEFDIKSQIDKGFEQSFNYFYQLKEKEKSNDTKYLLEKIENLENRLTENDCAILNNQRQIEIQNDSILSLEQNKYQLKDDLDDKFKSLDETVKNLEDKMGNLQKLQGAPLNTNNVSNLEVNELQQNFNNLSLKVKNLEPISQKIDSLCNQVNDVNSHTIGLERKITNFQFNSDRITTEQLNNTPSNTEIIRLVNENVTKGLRPYDSSLESLHQAISRVTMNTNHSECFCNNVANKSQLKYIISLFANNPFSKMDERIKSNQFEISKIFKRVNVIDILNQQVTNKIFSGENLPNFGNINTNNTDNNNF